MAKPKNYDPGLHGTINDEPSLTQQQYAEECDINFIMKRYTTQGLLPMGTTKVGTYDDFTTVENYLEAMNIITAAQNQLDQLPAQIRARFANDPAELLEFVTNPENWEQARQLGMLTEQAKPPTQPATTGTDAGTAPPPPAAPVK